MHANTDRAEILAPPASPPPPQNPSPLSPQDSPAPAPGDLQPDLAGEETAELTAPAEILEPSIDDSPLTGLLEALLFVSETPSSPAQFAQALGRPEAEILAGLTDLQFLYKETGRGLRLQEHNGRYALVTAPQAAGAIHTDFVKGFIRAETVAYEDFITQGGWAGAKTAGKVRSDGKDYVVKDGDVIIFRFNV